MRSFRIAAVAGASALAMTFGSISAVSAQDAVEPAPGAEEIVQGEENGEDKRVPVLPHTPVGTDDEPAEGGSLSSKINNGLNLDGDHAAQSPAIFGSSKDLDSQPRWAQLLYAGTILGAFGTVIGAIVGPIYNFFVHGPQA
ncbi:hypothetical protein [Corynebacterium suedekumii]|uniref:Or membrane protein n=1 Tax=Corynebacterium suedekumii TaxID=3049801 RepID=A0ABY8VKH4_9CORY|nr:hypothetical protein [Corynebacterium suedekumii]WIM69988.1 hypothetical protein QP029_12460 [Corynebacterium suedekumii]